MKKLLTIGLWAAIVLFVIRCIISMPEGTYEIFSCAGEAISIALILVGLYEKFLWRFNPFEKTPKIHGAYSGIIEYNYNDKSDNKRTNIVIKQSLLSIHVVITTNETTSYTIASNLIKDNGEYILYYTYITNPKNKYSDDNPIQYGTCRFNLTNVNELYGIYWTSRNTKGDIYLKRSVN